MSKIDALIKHVQSGEAVLIRSIKSFTDRVASVESLVGNPDIVFFSAPKILIDDIRAWSRDLRKSSMGKVHGVSKLGILVFDEILIPAQNILLKELEEIAPDVCILLVVHMHTVLIPTVMSRIVEVFESTSIDNVLDENIFPNAEYFKTEKNISKRLERIKKIVDAYDEGNVTKQDIVVWVESLQVRGGDTKLFVETITLLKQPATLLKYVLEFFVGWY